MNENANDGAPVVNKIPKIIHQIWYQGSQDLSEKYKIYQEKWQANHPEWDYRFWDETAIREFLNERHPWFTKYFDEYEIDMQRINAARYFILSTFGGFFFDMDMESIKPIDELMGDHELILSRSVGFNNAVVGTVPGHPFWQELIEKLVERRTRPPLTLTTWRHRRLAYHNTKSAGARFFTDCVNESRIYDKPGVKCYPANYFEPGSPTIEDGEVVLSKQDENTFVRHDMDMKWLPPFDQFTNKLFKPAFNMFWFFRKITK